MKNPAEKRDSDYLHSVNGQTAFEKGACSSPDRKMTNHLSFQLYVSVTLSSANGTFSTLTLHQSSFHNREIIPLYDIGLPASF